MKPAGGTRVYRWPVVQPGAHVEREYNLLPGTYVLWCAVADHRQRGMSARLVVRRC